MKILGIAAAAALSLSPGLASAQARIAPLLSTSVHRACAGEVSQTTLLDASGSSALNQPQVSRNTRAFRATRAGEGYAFEQSGADSWGDTILRVDVAADGAINNAQLSGAGFRASLAASTAPVDVQALAHSLAQEIPERLIVARSFAPGDHYYPEELRHALIGALTRALGMPFPVSGSADILYTGEKTQAGRRAYMFEGAITVQGAGQAKGAPVSIVSTSQVRIAHDVETGLVIDYDTRRRLELIVGGAPYLRTENSDRYSCRLLPQ